MAQNRLDKVLSDLGVASRKEIREIIRSGRVTVDGIVEKKPERKLDPESSRICLDGRALEYRRFHYYMMDKPLGVVTATEDPRQKTVLDLLPAELKGLGLFPVGRLDKDTSGLLILTNDGDFAHRVISPKSCVEKRYYARVEGKPEESDRLAFREGLILGDGTRCLPAKLEILGDNECLVTVMEGKYHQVRRMLASRGKPVLELRRLSEGGLSLDPDLGPGGIRELDQEDLCRVLGEYHLEK